MSGNGTTGKTKLLSKTSRTGFGIAGHESVWKPDQIIEKGREIERGFETGINQFKDAYERWKNDEEDNETSEGEEWLEPERPTTQFPGGEFPQSSTSAAIAARTAATKSAKRRRYRR